MANGKMMRMSNKLNTMIRDINFFIKLNQIKGGTKYGRAS